MNSFRRWLTRQVEKLTQMRDRVSRDPDFYEAELELAGSILEEAGDRAAKLGLSQLHAESVAATGALPDAVLTFLSKCIAVCEAALPKTDLMPPSRVAKRCGVKYDKVMGWIRSGELKATNVAKKRGDERYKVHPADLDTFLKAREVTPLPKVTHRRRELPAGVTKFY